MKHSLSTLLLLLFGAFVSAQNHHHNCGVRHADDAEIKTRMQRNRSTISETQLATLRNGGPIYIPVTIHLIGSDAGSGFASPENAMEMICRLNSDCADQNIVFYLNGNVRYIYDDYLHADSYGWGQMSGMGSRKIANSLNIFVNANVSQPVAGYYSPSQDFIFMANSYANGNSTTITHEAGHFFSLPHTFYGWEGENAPALYSGTPAPSSINGNPVENVARNNCYIAGDGFCDTGADYISFRFSCPFSSSVQDPSGTTLTVDPSFYMSYSSDECMSRFSQEQKDAILADITGRGWLSLAAPTSTTPLSSNNLSPVEPAQGSTISTSTGSTMRFEWDTIGASTATRWMFVLERTVLGSSVGTTYQTITNGQNFVNVPLSLFISNRDYRWSVLPYSDGYVCAGSSAFFTFKTGIISAMETIVDKNFSFNVYPNPNNGETVNLNINSDLNTVGTLRLYSADGRLCMEMQNLEIGVGSQNFQLNVANLGTGMYFVVLNTDKGAFTEKLMINK